MKTLRIAGIIEESIVDGPGLRSVLFVQGCPHGCPGCHNPRTHDFSGGETLSVREVFARLTKEKEIRAVTFSGGEPFSQSDALLDLARMLKDAGYNIMTYSGFTFEELLDKSKTEPEILGLLKLCDILVDGRFLIGEKDLSLRFRGSRNQRLINLKDTFLKGKICEYD
jgi:anaerobic ribonucleoside-triphosphate reductase activating protein